MLRPFAQKPLPLQPKTIRQITFDMKRLFTALLVVMAVLTIRAQEGNPYNITAANQTVSVTFYTPDIVRGTKVPVGYEYN